MAYSLKQIAKHLYEVFTHFIGSITRRYYFEDYIRVYPDQNSYSRFGIKQKMHDSDIRNFINHRKFYEFASQFVCGREVVDIGCGSGYGCEVLSQHQAKKISGCDLSNHALRFARKKYGNIAEFKKLGITNLHDYADSSFDVTISSEVLEHIKEYHLENKAVEELRRVTRENGIVIVGTPNSELLDDHGFSFDEINTLFRTHFTEFVIFENALVPFGDHKGIWLQRLEQNRIGVIISEHINFNETVLPKNAAAELKTGLRQGVFHLGDFDIDTSLLHNTHSWVIVAIK